MCPDYKVLSAFYDGEVSSPWKEKIEDHVQICEDCRAVLNDYRDRTAQLLADPEPVSAGNFNDIQRLIRHKENTRSENLFLPALKSPGFPLAAAAAAVLAFFLGFSMAGSTGPSASFSDIPLAVSEGWSIPPGDLMIPGEDIEAMLSLINQAESSLFSQESSLSLPGDLNLALHGDSELVRTASYSGGSSR